MDHACERMEHGFRQRRNVGGRVNSLVNAIANNVGKQVCNDRFVVVAAFHVLLGRHQDHFEYIRIVVEILMVLLHQRTGEMAQP